MLPVFGVVELVVARATAGEEVEHGDAERETSHGVEAEYDDRLRERFDFFREPVERGVDEFQNFRRERLIVRNRLVEVGRRGVRTVDDLDDLLDNLRQRRYVLQPVYYFL